MNISGIRPTAGFYSYNSIKTNVLRGQQIMANQKEEVTQEESSDEDEYSRRKQNFTSFDYAKNYRPDVIYDLNRNEADIELLDIGKMKEDLKKDQILQQYQYFVRGTEYEEKIRNSGDTAQRLGENFLL